MSVTVRVPAKVNVQLAVGARRAPTASTTWPTSSSPSALYDEVTATPADDLRDHLSRARTPHQVPAGPHEPGRPRGRSRSPRATASSRDVHLHIAKDIPVAGGMAGGSADGGGRAAGLRRAVGDRRLAATNCSTSAPSWAATCRSAWSAGRRSAPAGASS